jgi:hypothetical protein
MVNAEKKMHATQARLHILMACLNNLTPLSPAVGDPDEALDHAVRLVYQPPANSTFLSDQTSHQQDDSSTFLSEQTSTRHHPNDQVVAVDSFCLPQDDSTPARWKSHFSGESGIIL